MKNPLILKVATRAQTGRSASRRLRKVNRIPACLLYTSTGKADFDL